MAARAQEAGAQGAAAVAVPTTPILMGAGREQVTPILMEAALSREKTAQAVNPTGNSTAWLLCITSTSVRCIRNSGNATANLGLASPFSLALEGPSVRKRTLAYCTLPRLSVRRVADAEARECGFGAPRCPPTGRRKSGC
jgi:hypothetical protein